MTDVAIDTLADDPQLLKRLLKNAVARQAATADELHATSRQRDAALVRAVQAESERDALRHQLALKLRSLYGRSSEKIDPRQLELFVTRVERIVHESADEDESVTVPAHALGRAPPSRGGGPRRVRGAAALPLLQPAPPRGPQARPRGDRDHARAGQGRAARPARLPLRLQPGAWPCLGAGDVPPFSVPAAMRVR